MKNFKEIAEKCLAGELSGTFILKKHTPLHSEYLHTMINREQQIISGYYYLEGIILNDKGKDISGREQVQNFIPDNMQKKIEIDIPEGKVPIMEQTENGVVITWKDTELTYNRIYQSIYNDDKAISSVNNTLRNDTSNRFFIKINVLRKLLNIRNYFGNPTDGKGYGIFYHEYSKKFYADVLGPFSPVHVCFSTKEQAEQAIKMLGDELKYLFEPW